MYTESQLELIYSGYSAARRKTELELEEKTIADLEALQVEFFDKLAALRRDLSVLGKQDHTAITGITDRLSDIHSRLASTRRVRDVLERLIGRRPPLSMAGVAAPSPTITELRSWKIQALVVSQLQGFFKDMTMFKAGTAPQTFVYDWRLRMQKVAPVDLRHHGQALLQTFLACMSKAPDFLVPGLLHALSSVSNPTSEQICEAFMQLMDPTGTQFTAQLHANLQKLSKFRNETVHSFAKRFNKAAELAQHPDGVSRNLLFAQKLKLSEQLSMQLSFGRQFHLPFTEFVELIASAFRSAKLAANTTDGNGAAERGALVGPCFRCGKKNTTAQHWASCEGKNSDNARLPGVNAVELVEMEDPADPDNERFQPVCVLDDVFANWSDSDDELGDELPAVMEVSEVPACAPSSVLDAYEHDVASLPPLRADVWAVGTPSVMEISSMATSPPAAKEPRAVQADAPAGPSAAVLTACEDDDTQCAEGSATAASAVDVDNDVVEVTETPAAGSADTTISEGHACDEAPQEKETEGVPDSCPVVRTPARVGRQLYTSVLLASGVRSIICWRAFWSCLVVFLAYVVVWAPFARVVSADSVGGLPMLAMVHTPNSVFPLGYQHAAVDPLLLPAKVLGADDTVLGSYTAFFDYGAAFSIIDPAVVRTLKLQIHPRKLPFRLANGTTTYSEGYVRVRLECNRRSHDVIFYVVPTGRGMLLGRELHAPFGVVVAGVCDGVQPGVSDEPSPTLVEPSADFSMLTEDEFMSRKKVFADACRAREAVFCPDVNALWKDRAFVSALEENCAIPVGTLCTHPASVISLERDRTASAFTQQYPIHDSLRAVASAQVEQWLSNGVIEPAGRRTPFNSPLIVVKKKDAEGHYTKHRFCLDLRKVNATLSDTQGDLAVPRISELFLRFKGAKVFSCLDLRASYHQFKLDEKDRDTTCFTFAHKRFRFRSCPFGLKPLTALFQAGMETILEGCEDCAVIYVDDVIVFSPNMRLHKKALRRVLRRFNKYKLQINREKCQFGLARIEVLGHIISADGRSIDPEKVNAFLNVAKPRTATELRSIIGTVDYLREYVPMMSDILAPLQGIKNSKHVPSDWSSIGGDAILRRLKSVLMEAPLLSFPVDDAQFHVATDASDVAMGATLYQVIDGEKRYVQMVSKSFSPSQAKYSATKKETLGVVFALQRFRHFLYGRKFRVHTDHRALTFLFSKEKLNRMELEWLDVLLEHNFTVSHIAGQANVLPDALSRLLFRKPRVALNALSLDVLTRLPDRELVQLVQQRFDKQCPAVQDRQALLQRYHGTDHFNGEELYQRLWQAGFYWPRMRVDCRVHTGACDQCIKHNIGRSSFRPPRSVSARMPFDQVSVDLCSFNVTSPRGHNYVLVYTDVASRYTLLRPLKSKTRQEVARVLWGLFCDFGFPMAMQSDNGREFVNTLLAELQKTMGVARNLIAPYNPRSNGLAESSVKTTCKILYKTCRGNISNFDLYLPAVQWALNTRISRVTGASPLAHVFLKPIVPPEDHQEVPVHLLTNVELTQRIAKAHEIMFPELVHYMRKRQVDQRQQASRRGRNVSSKKIPVGSSVMLKDVHRSKKFEPRWVGPFKVVGVSRALTYSLVDSTLQLLKRKVPLDQLKLVDLPTDDVLARRAIRSSTGEVADCYIVEGIRRHRGVGDDVEYFVKWQGYPETDNTWVKATDFEDEACIVNYWLGQRADGQAVPLQIRGPDAYFSLPVVPNQVEDDSEDSGNEYDPLHGDFMQAIAPCQRPVIVDNASPARLPSIPEEPAEESGAQQRRSGRRRQIPWHLREFSV